MRHGKHIAIFLGDILILVGSLALAILIGYPYSEFENQFFVHIAPFLFIFPLWILIYYLTNLYRFVTFRTPLQLGGTVLRSVILAGLLSILAFYLFPDFFELTPKTNLFVFSAVFGILSFGERILAIRIFSSSALRILFLGDSPLMEKTVTFIRNNPQTGYHIHTWIQDKNSEEFKNLSQTVQKGGISLVVVHPSFSQDPVISQTVFRLLPHEITVLNFFDVYEEIFERAPLDELETSWFIQNISTHRPFYDTAKRVIDIVFSFILGVIFLPLGILISFFIAVTSRGSVIYPQKRIGKDGKAFTLHKFRTMYQNSSGSLWTEKNDSRITPVGKALRFSHLDELPQLWDILTGHISFTGPRPERSELAQQYQSFPYYDVRHIVKPGLTGWAQISFRPSASIEEAYEKLMYDIYYVKNRSLLLDLLIIIRTARYFFVSHS